MHQKKKGSFYVIAVFCLAASTSFFEMAGLKFGKWMAGDDVAIQIEIVLQDFSAIEIEDLFTSRIEAGLTLLPGILNVKSATFHGASIITVKTDRSLDASLRRLQVNNLLEEILSDGELKGLAPAVRIRDIENENMKPVLSFYLSGNNSIREEAESIKERLEELFGSCEVRINYKVPWHSLTCDAEWLIHAGVTPEEFSGSIDPETPSYLSIGEREEAVQLDHFGKEYSLFNTPLRSINERTFNFGEFLENKKFERKEETYTRVNGKESVYMEVYFSGHHNPMLAYLSLRRFLNDPENVCSEITIAYDPIKIFIEQYVSRCISPWTLFILSSIVLVMIFAGIRISLLLLMAFSLKLMVVFASLKLLNILITPLTLIMFLPSVALFFPWGLLMVSGVLSGALMRARMAVLASMLVVVLSGLALLRYGSVTGHDLILCVQVICVSIIVSSLTVSFLVPAIFGLGVLRPGKHWLLIEKLIHRRSLGSIRVIGFRIKLLFFSASIMVVCLFGLPVHLVVPFETGSDPERNTDNHLCLNMSALGRKLEGSVQRFAEQIKRLRVNHDLHGDQMKVMLRFPPGTKASDIKDFSGGIEKVLLERQRGIKIITRVLSNRWRNLDIRLEEYQNDLQFREWARKVLLHELLKSSGVEWHLIDKNREYHSISGKDYQENYRWVLKGYNIHDLIKEKQRITETLKTYSRIKIDENTYKVLGPVDEIEIPIDIDKIGYDEEISRMIEWQNFSLLVGESPYGILKINAVIEGIDKLLGIYPCGVTDSTCRIEKPGNSFAIHRENQQYFTEIPVCYLGLKQSGDKWMNEFKNHEERTLPAGFHLDLSDNDYHHVARDKCWQPIFIVMFILISILTVILESLRKPVIIILFLMIYFIIAENFLFAQFSIVILLFHLIMEILILTFGIFTLGESRRSPEV